MPARMLRNVTNIKQKGCNFILSMLLYKYKKQAVIKYKELNTMDTNVFTKTEYIPDYQGISSFYVTYDLNNKTITVDGRTKPMTRYWYKKAIAYKNAENK